ncbi:hypothetical protein BN982_00166 [Halobacillus karajensis]|nr:hypothetical protein BN982_00166 [Halobacillus karajensis]
MLQSEKRYLREEQILTTLNNLGFATRKQIQVIEKLGSDRNAARILKRMENEKSIQSFRREFKVYSLTHHGKELIGSSKDLKTGASDRLVDHTLMRNELYIKLGMPIDWRTEKELLYNKQQDRIVVDAMYSRNGEWHFVEVDNKQTMKNNREKLKKYAIFKKDIFRDYGHHPTVIWYTVSENRKQKLEEWMREYGIKGEVYV